MKKWCVPVKMTMNVFVEADDSYDADYAYERVQDATWSVRNYDRLHTSDPEVEVGKPVVWDEADD